VTREELQDIFMSEFPLRAKNDLASLEFVELSDRGGEQYGTVVRLIVWDEIDGKSSIRDVKEQDVYLDLPHDCTFERLVIYLRGMEMAMEDVLASPQVETLMPHDLLDWSALKLRKAETAEDFDKALRLKSRLGKYLLPS
jgi:hypothetical protein